MNFIIIGDKFQKGMKSKGCAGLIKFNNSLNIFEHQYKTINKFFPKAKIIYIAGFEYRKIENFIKKHYSDVLLFNNTNFENSNDCYSLNIINKLLIYDTFITFGYTILNSKPLEKFNKLLGSQVFLTNNNKSSVGCIIQNNIVENISLDLPNTIDDLYYISDKDIKNFKEIATNHKYHNYFVFELLNNLIENHKIKIVPSYYTSKQKTHEYTK